MDDVQMNGGTNAPIREESSSSMGVVLGIILIIALIVLFYIFGFKPNEEETEATPTAEPTVAVGDEAQPSGSLDGIEVQQPN